MKSVGLGLVSSFVAGSAITKLATGMFEPAATSVPPFVTVNVAVYDVDETLVNDPRVNPPIVPEVKVYV